MSVELEPRSSTQPRSVSIDVTEAPKKPSLVADLEAADSGWKKYVNKANVSNFATFVVMIIGLVLELFVVSDSCGKQCWSRYILSFGLFAFAGGITNWLAITMLFDEIPFVYGSGIIPKQFEEIKRTIANMIMDTFFEPEFLQRQLSSRTKDLGNRDEIKKALRQMLESDAFDELLDKKLNEMQDGKGITGSLMKAFNVQGTSVKPMLKRFVSSVAMEFTGVFLKVFDPASFFDEKAVLKMRGQIEKIIEDRLRELTADKVKYLMEIVIRVHLGWLVVWGNVFGGIIGVASTAAGY